MVAGILGALSVGDIEAPPEAPDPGNTPASRINTAERNQITNKKQKQINKLFSQSGQAREPPHKIIRLNVAFRLPA
jgi:hypothetical protein